MPELLFNTGLAIKLEEMRGCVKQINPDSWLIGGKLVLHRTTSAEEYLWKDNSNGLCYVLSTPPATPEAHPLPPESDVQIVRLHRDSAVWSFGDAFLKVRSGTPDDKATKEYTTLNWLAQQKLPFDIPKALYYTEESRHTFLFVSRVPGVTLNEAWRTMSFADKEYYVEKVADICEELCSLTSGAIQGVDGGYLSDVWLDVCDGDDLSPDTLLANWKNLGMECNTFVFSHNDLGPTNIIVNLDHERGLGIIDWEMAGYVPRAWVRTKPAFSVGYDFEWRDAEAGARRQEWRERVEKKLGDRGFQNVWDDIKAGLEVRRVQGIQ